MTTKEIKKCLDQIEKEFPGAEKYISMLETKLFMMKLEEEFKVQYIKLIGLTALIPF